MSGSESANQVATCTVVGASHLRHGRPCQDASGSFVGAGWAGVAVADGHSSAAHGDEGAEVAVQVALAQLDQFGRVFEAEMRERPDVVLRRAREALPRSMTKEWVRTFCERRIEPSELPAFGCTLAFALALGDHLLVGRLGDGDLVLVESSGTAREPLARDPACFAEQTPSLCMDEAWASMALGLLPRPRPDGLLLLATDGYANSYATQEEFLRIGPDYLDLVREHGAEGVGSCLPGFLERITAEGSGDYISLALIYLHSGSAP